MKNSSGKIGIIIVVIILILVAGAAGWYFTIGKDMFKEDEKTKTEEKKVDVDKVQGEEQKVSSEFEIKGSSLGAFDLEFLKLENKEENMIYSPLSIKYTLGMLNEGTGGNSKSQIESIIGNYLPNKYSNTKNMSFANALFIRDSFKDSVKERFISNLSNKYGADVEFDSFNSAKRINTWISDKTLNLIEDALNDSDVEDLNFALVNSLAIDMDWEHKFLEPINYECMYDHEKFCWFAPDNVIEGKFKNVKNKISGMQVISSINNYDIINELGEDNIRKTVGDAFKAFLEKHPDSYFFSEYETKDIDTIVEEYLEGYMEVLKGHYGDVSTNTDYTYYVDDDVKAFGKDLKTYSDVTLEYIAIMPKNEDLKSFVDNSDASSISEIIENLKTIDTKNAKEGVITAISGYIPKFKFDYDLDLINDLQEMGISDVFDSSKANLEGITDEKAYIGSAVHKANIELTQDGIKAAAATMMGGLGAGEEFNYYFEVPVEEIDLVFDNPYMFIIRDKDTGEVWFAGTVYEPLDAKEDPENGQMSTSMVEFSINWEDYEY